MKQMSAKEAKRIAEKLQKVIPGGYGFALVLYPFGTSAQNASNKSMTVSNMREEDQIKVLRSAADDMELRAEAKVAEKH